ncbi:hypothetical protein HanHA300_Chr08g0288041 [Helianthus annuus]|nr:hypothetical protein HanHA300_Chr08g0288041 [Helianthus annuus]KAJ0554318.1 hypothetical protein HanHA89_Chr08g0306381 [Helianthus annuus]KAJ0719913.1 hypothetical protein HanLR1_Chr08g0287091 [Helianthus annuus]KAJ0723142.1 hypothetical protein HanOQP8_Chr08g0294621 [Helianthus annuus]
MLQLYFITIESSAIRDNVMMGTSSEASESTRLNYLSKRVAFDLRSLEIGGFVATDATSFWSDFSFRVAKVYC